MSGQVTTPLGVAVAGAFVAADGGDVRQRAVGVRECHMWGKAGGGVARIAYVSRGSRIEMGMTEYSPVEGHLMMQVLSNVLGDRQRNAEALRDAWQRVGGPAAAAEMERASLIAEVWAEARAETEHHLTLLADETQIHDPEGLDRLVAGHTIVDRTGVIFQKLDYSAKGWRRIGDRRKYDASVVSLPAVFLYGKG